MNNVTYKHACGLQFTTERLMSQNEDQSYDICVVCLWLPNSTSDPMILIGWYCGEATLENTKELADKWVAELTYAEINELIACQDLPNC